MSIRIKCVIIVVLILGLLKILGLIKKNKLELKYALSWLFLELGIFIITLIPNLLNVISKALGIYNEINMLFFLGFVFIILVIFSLTMSLSRNSERVRKMAQEIALNSYYNNKKNKYYVKLVTMIGFICMDITIDEIFSINSSIFDVWIEY